MTDLALKKKKKKVKIETQIKSNTDKECEMWQLQGGELFMPYDFIHKFDTPISCLYGCIL